MIDVYDNTHMVDFTMGSSYYWWDGIPSELPYPLQVRNDRTFIPLIIFLNAWRMTYTYDGSVNAIHISFSASHEKYPPDPFLNESPHATHAMVLSCWAHGFIDGADTLTDDWHNCPINTFFVPQTYRSFGHELPKSIIKGGLATDDYYISYFNQQAIIHGGFRVPTYGEAWSATFDQVVMDITAAEAGRMVWELASAAGAGAYGAAKNWNANAAVPEQPGWGLPKGGQSMSESAIRWQSEVSRQEYQLTKQGARGTHIWSIREFAYIGSKGKIWFDAGNSAERVLVDAKYINPKWLKPGGPFSVFKNFYSNFVMKHYLKVALRQMEIVDDGWIIHWRFNSEEALDAWLKWLRDIGREDVIKRIFFTR
jgi:hypothetical protein